MYPAGELAVLRQLLFSSGGGEVGAVVGGAVNGELKWHGGGDQNNESYHKKMSFRVYCYNTKY